jgi:hypothetical protein
MAWQSPSLSQVRVETTVRQTYEREAGPRTSARRSVAW